MNKMVECTKCISRKTGWNQGKIFLVLHILQWVCLAFAGAAAVLLVSYVADLSGIYVNALYQNAAMILFCAVGYVGFFAGCLGGVLQWYNKGTQKQETVAISVDYQGERKAKYGRISFPMKAKYF